MNWHTSRLRARCGTANGRPSWILADADSARIQRYCAESSWTRGKADELAQAVLAGSRHYQGRSAAVLRGCVRAAAAAFERSRDGHEALSARRVRRILFYEARARA